MNAFFTLGAAGPWWLAAGLLIAAELATGTFYLLMIAVGLAAAAISVHFGVAFTTQIVVAAVVGGLAVFVLNRFRRKRRSHPARSNPDVNMDIGNLVNVAVWNSDGTAEVQYRGAAWSARFEGSGEPLPGRFVIRALDGSQLVLHPAPSPHHH